VAHGGRVDSLGMRATVALNSNVCEAFPHAIDQMKKRGWEFMGHGITNSKTLANLSLDEERQTSGKCSELSSKPRREASRMARAWADRNFQYGLIFWPRRASNTWGIGITTTSPTP